METTSERKPHSAEYFGDSRDYWWNPDFLRLMATRWNLSEVRTVLDVGCGIGHWGRLIASITPDSAHIVGVDREPAWVAKAGDLAKERGLDERLEYRQGTAEQLPFPDGTFDLVTCQTVLIHVPDPRKVLAEMLRVLKPGGLIILSEPNNLANALVFDSVSFAAPVDELMTLLRAQLICERGKAALGEGNNSVGGLVPGYLSELGAEAIAVYLSDKAGALLPPYSSTEQQANVREMLEWAGREFWIWDRFDTSRYFHAGGGDPAEFDSVWALGTAHRRCAAEAVRAGTYALAGGQVSYLVSGRKPRPVGVVSP